MVMVQSHADDPEAHPGTSFTLPLMILCYKLMIMLRIQQILELPNRPIPIPKRL